MKHQMIKKAEEKPKQQGPNLTGIPTQMKLDFEQRSGLSFDSLLPTPSQPSRGVVQGKVIVKGTPCSDLKSLGAIVFTILSEQDDLRISIEEQMVYECLDDMIRFENDVQSFNSYFDLAMEVYLTLLTNEEESEGTETSESLDSQQYLTELQAVIKARLSAPFIQDDGNYLTILFYNYAGPYVTLYRTMEQVEYDELIATIQTTGRPLFKHKQTNRDRNRAEKFFTPNFEYLFPDFRLQDNQQEKDKASKKNKLRKPKPGQDTPRPMGEKGSRHVLVIIDLFNEVIKGLLYNPDYAKLEANTHLNVALKKVQKNDNTAIIVKNESSNEFQAFNLGFRNGNDSLDELTEYIWRIRVIKNTTKKEDLIRFFGEEKGVNDVRNSLRYYDDSLS